MVSDQDLAKSVETLLRQSDPNAVTTLNGVVQQLEANLGLDLSHKAGFIRDQINSLLRPYPLPKDHYALQQYQQYQNCQPQFHNPHFALQQLQQQQQLFQQQQQVQLRQQQVQKLTAAVPLPLPPQVVKGESNVKKEAPKSSEAKKESTPAKRRGGPGGLNKVCGVSPELQVIVGEPALSRTEIVKQLWAYIRKNNLQDPSNKRKIICDDALRVVFETDCTDMFKMNKLLAKHIIRLEPTKETNRSKKLKVEVEPASESAVSGPPASESTVSGPPASESTVSGPPAPHNSPPVVLISEALACFFGTGEREMLQSEALGRIWEYIKINHLEDPMNSMVILCDAKLRELFGCESISALGISEMLARHHLYKQ